MKDKVIQQNFYYYIVFNNLKSFRLIRLEIEILINIVIRIVISLIIEKR